MERLFRLFEARPIFNLLATDRRWIANQIIWNEHCQKISDSFGVIGVQKSLPWNDQYTENIYVICTLAWQVKLELTSYKSVTKLEAQ